LQESGVAAGVWPPSNTREESSSEPETKTGHIAKGLNAWRESNKGATFPNTKSKRFLQLLPLLNS